MIHADNNFARKPLAVRHRWLVLAVGSSLGIFFLWLAIRGTNITDIVEALSRIRLVYTIPLLTALYLSYWVKALRWSALLGPLRRVRTVDLFPAIMIGFAWNAVLPAQLGELVRMGIVGRRLRIKNTSVLGTIVLERMFDFLTVMLLLGGSLVSAGRASPELARVGYFVGGIGSIIFAVCLAFVAWTNGSLAVLGRVLFFLPTRFQEAILHQMELGAMGLVAMRSRRVVLGVLVMTFVQWLLMGICIYVSLLAVGIDVPLSAAFTVVAFNVAGLTLPSTPGFFGTIQLCFILALRPYGVNTGDAFAASVFWHLVAFTSVMVVAFLSAAAMGFSFRDIHEQAKEP